MSTEASHNNSGRVREKSDPGRRGRAGHAKALVRVANGVSVRPSGEVDAEKVHPSRRHTHGVKSTSTEAPQKSRSSGSVRQESNLLWLAASVGHCFGGYRLFF